MLISTSPAGARDQAEACSDLTSPIEAEAACTGLIDTAGGAGPAWALNNLGLALAMRGDFLGALSAYDLAIAAAPGMAAAVSNRGNAHAALGDMIKALADHEMAIELDPEDVRARHNRAVDLEELGRYREALDAYRDVLTRDPSHAGAQVGRATASCKLGRVKGSAEARLAAIRSGALDAVAMQQTLKAAGHYRGAIDGLFGKGSRAALWAWTREGCRARA